ncbi:MAG: hypothetical protein AAB383_05965 [Patescibacteria group bacterium]
MRAYKTKAKTIPGSDLREVRRLKYFTAAIELLERTRLEPKSKENPNKKGEILHRFTGITKDSEIFYVQVKENKNTGQKHLISVFPEQ